MGKVFPVLMYSDFYQTKVIPDDPLSPIRQFDLEDVIIGLILLRNSINKKDVTDLQNPVIQSITRRLPQPKQNRLISFLTNPQAPYVLTHSVVITKIISDIFRILKFNTPTESMGSVKLESALFDILIIYNEFHYRATLEPKPDDHQVVWRILLMQDISGVDEFGYSRTGIAKHLIFVKFLKLKLGEQYKRFESKVLQLTGTTTILEFLLILLNVYLQATKGENGLVSIDKNDRAYQILIDAEMVIDQELASSADLDLGTIISHPFFKTADGKMILIDYSDFSLIADKIWSFFLFAKAEISDFLPKVNSKNNYFSFLGKEYVEQFQMRTLFRTLEKAGSRVIFTDDTNLPDIALILNEKDVFLFEIKASALHFNVMDKQDVDGFQKFLDENFAEGKKGAKQLANNVGYLSNDRKNLYQLRCPQHKLTIYPVIIFTDPHLNKSAVNDYVCQKAMPLFDEHRSQFKEIRPLTMIDADFFLENITLLQADRSLLKRTINSYHQNFKKKIERYSKFRSTSNYMDAMVSFDRFSADREGLYRLDKLKIFENLNALYQLRED